VKFISATASLLAALELLGLAQVQGHGFLKTPRSRNFVAQEDGTWSGGAGSAGIPQKETCHHCLNVKESQNLCGKGNANTLYDHWKDINGVPMEWSSQAVYEEGQEFIVESVLTTNHAGHMEIWLCPMGDDSTQECLHQNAATMVRDELHGGPADWRYPERGYFASGASEFKFTYRLPENFHGENILMQWHYVTANSCIPPGYRDGEAGERLSELGWLRSMGMGDCPDPPNPTGSGVPEQFWNCAEITITPKTPSPPTTSPPVAPPVSSPVAQPTPPSPTPPTGGMIATTTRYWDCSGGACGCAYLPFEGDTNNPAHCYSNSMFEAPADNPYGAKFYGSAAISAALFEDNDGDGWLGEGCDKCWKVTGTSNTPGYEWARTTTMVLKGSNYCPPENPACSGGKAHFDIAAPGFDVTAFSFAHVCPQLEEEEAEAFAACGKWMIDVQDPAQNCDCSKFKNPVLRAGCENFLYLQWDNAQVEYEEVACPYELDRLSCWRENNDGYPFDIPKFCASNLDGPSPPPPPAPTPTPPPTPAPTPPPTPPPVSNCSGNVSACCTQNMKDCVSWCGSTKDSCMNCSDAFWTECPNQNCKARWSDCTNDVDGCCDGLSCVGNQWYRQCKVATQPPPTPSPTPPPAPSPTPAPTKTPDNGCYSNNYKDCIHPDYATGGSSCNKIWLPDGALSNCIALWGDCTSQTNSCCGDAVCFSGPSDNSYATCVPPS